MNELILGHTRKAIELTLNFGETAEGKPAIIITGNTFSVKDRLATIATWNSRRKAWCVPCSDDDAEFKATIEKILDLGFPTNTHSQDFYEWYQEVK